MATWFLGGEAKPGPGLKCALAKQVLRQAGLLRDILCAAEGGWAALPSAGRTFSPPEQKSSRYAGTRGAGEEGRGKATWQPSQQGIKQE